MQDRTPTPGQEGRVLITPENGNGSFYAKIEMADNPTQNGTAYSKHDVLQDVTCDSIGIPHESTPNDAFLALSLGVGKYGYIITVLLPDGSPAVGATITGGVSPSGDTPITNEDGVAIIVAESQSLNLSVQSPYIDISDSGPVQIQSTGILTPYTITLQATGERTFTSSYSGKTSPFLLSFDLCGVGGGGGGGENRTGSPTAMSPGGGGGYVDNAVGIQSIAEEEIQLVVGAGGIIGTVSAAGDGGKTSVIYNQTEIISANGGGGALGQLPTGAANPGGVGNGNGGGGQNNTQNLAANGGDAATVYKYNDPALGIPGGGGGGSGGYPVFQGGSPNGAHGADTYLGGHNAGTPGPGGGGGGSASTNGFGAASPGGAGVIYFRPHYKQEVT